MYEKMIAAIVRQTQERQREIDKSSITTYKMLYSEGRAKTELETLRKDAERYRWLRAQHWNTSPLCVVCDPKDAVKLGHICPSGESLDVAVDAAMLAARTAGPDA
jgi:hypothetical protein